MIEILQNIESIRKEKGIKQSVIADALGVKQPAYSNYMNRSDDIWFMKLSQIANILNISVVDIITFPIKWVPESEKCNACKEKDLIIKNLNEYINLLKNK